MSAAAARSCGGACELEQLEQLLDTHAKSTRHAVAQSLRRALLRFGNALDLEAMLICARAKESALPRMA